MSFSTEIKDEAARVMPDSGCCALSELAAALGAGGSIHLQGGGRLSLTFATEHAPTARREKQLLWACFHVKPEMSVSHTARLGGRNAYTLSLSGDAALDVLTRCGILRTDEKGQRSLSRSIPARLLSRKCCRRAFLRGAFLAAGSMTSPDKEYHLEFVLSDEAFAGALIGVLQKCGLRAKMIRRKGAFVVYLKDVEQIVSLLGQMGAHGALLTLESVRVEKDVRNAVNRAVNCDSANLSKTVDASERQVQAIEYLRDRGALSTLPEPLQEVAETRLSHREATLLELGEMLDPPIGKSGVNHRLRRLMRMAEAMKQQEEDRA